MVPVRIFHCKVTTFPFIIDTQLGGDIFRLCDYPQPHPSFTQDLTHSLMIPLLESIITMTVTSDFSDPIIYELALCCKEEPFSLP